MAPSAWMVSIAVTAVVTGLVMMEPDGVLACAVRIAIVQAMIVIVMTKRVNDYVLNVGIRIKTGLTLTYGDNKLSTSRFEASGDRDVVSLFVPCLLQWHNVPLAEESTA